MTERTRIDRIADERRELNRPKDKPKAKEEPSAFDRLVEQGRRVPIDPLARVTIQQATEQGTRDVKRREEDHGEDRRRREKGDEEKDRGADKRERPKEGKAVEQRVVAKGMLKDSRGEGGGRGQSQGFAGGGGRQEFTLGSKKIQLRHGPISLVGRFEAQLKASLVKSPEAPRITQAILNQLVQCVRVGLNQKGEKEIEVHLHEQAFRGLTLRVTNREGKVAVVFHAKDARTRRLFEKESQSIHDALTKRGIPVDEIVVS